MEIIIVNTFNTVCSFTFLSIYVCYSQLHYLNLTYLYIKELNCYYYYYYYYYYYKD